MYQHQVCIGFNKACVVIESDEPLPLDSGPDTKLIINVINYDIKRAHAKLQSYAKLLCKDVPETSLLSLHAINHQIPLIDESKIYSQDVQKPSGLKGLRNMMLI